MIEITFTQNGFDDFVIGQLMKRTVDLKNIDADELEKCISEYFSERYGKRLKEVFFNKTTKENHIIIQ